MIDAPPTPAAAAAPPGHAALALDLCTRIAACTDTPGSITRTFLSPSTRQVHALLRAEMARLGVAARVDSAGNLRGIYPGQTPNAPVLLLGSHIDTVPDAGAFDGILGVALPLALLHALESRRLPFAIEVIAFSEEEGVRFKLPFIGSRALLGDLGQADLARTDASGITLAQAMRDFGLGAGSSPDRLEDAALTPGTFAFLEVHIEQGPVLEALDLPLGVVDAIAGQTRLQVTFTGSANHAGTTPMHLRRDALAAAAEWMVEVERHARATAGLVATVGAIQAQPGAANVIPGAAVLSLDVRHAHDDFRLQAVRDLLVVAKQIAEARGIVRTAIRTSHQATVPMDHGLRALLAEAVRASGRTPHAMPSGAGHDAMILAPRVPSAMLFVRSPGGISHHPGEAVLAADVQAALDVCLHLLNTLEPPKGAA